MSDDSVTIRLSAPITAHAREISEVTLRRPKGKDIVACGYPLQLGEGAAVPQAGAIAKYIARLGGIPPSSVDQIAPEDFNEAMGVIVGFFGQSDRTETPPPD